MPQRKLEQLLLSARVVDPADLANGVAEADQAQTRVAWSLVASGVIDERVLARIVAEGTKTELIERLPDEVPSWVFRRLPASIARQYRVVPIDLTEETLTVAMMDPTDSDAIEVLAAASRLKIIPVVALKSSLERLMEHIYPFDIDVDATQLSNRDQNGDTGGQDVDTNPVRPEPGMTTLEIPRPASKAAAAPAPESIEKRLEAVEKQLDQISTLAAQARLALAQFRKEKK